MNLTTAPRVTPFLWFNDDASEAVDFYLSVFPNSRRNDGLKQPGSAKPLVISFELDGQFFTALNGGPGHPFTDAISLVVRCDNQEEIDFYWGRLLADGGEEIMCGWLKDKYGLRWQITPARVGELLRHPKAMEAMMKMKKLDIAELERAGRE